MKRISILMGVLFSAFSFVSAQTNKSQMPAKPAEQKEIKADKHIEKEIQQKQLSDKPQLLNEKSSSTESKKALQEHLCKSKKSRIKSLKKI